ncbi:hypothetical protein EDF56_101130 [Novosphingobium sp. PhB165]|uniref:hypothetical protein n=1 Tax=Novosphingobium sp. PhB165 TaxID=2485105 RepID=UPI0010514105|nr:hypothetical protein [Novosphingobium sp. PhB165]TCM21466.1 hypothetical protein EDF56_101130 [Novosphingobium sp. PhB165]
MITITTPDGRRAWAFIAIVGGCIVFTAFAAVGVYLSRTVPDHVFFLALAAHVQVLVGTTGLAALLVKRTIRAGRDGIEISDDAAAGAQVAAGAAQAVADDLASADSTRARDAEVKSEATGRL